MKHSRLADIAAPLGLLWRRQSLSRRIMLTLLVAMLPFVLVILLTSANSRWAISDSFDSLLMDDTRKRSQIVSMELDAFNDMLFQLVSETRWWTSSRSSTRPKTRSWATIMETPCTT